MRAPVLIMGTALCALCLPAFADDHPPEPDKVSFTVSAEDWVQTTTANVTVHIDATLPGADAGKTRADMQKAVASLAGDAEWRFASFDHAQDQSGLETWHAELEARLKETALGGLADKAKSASKPGLQIKIGDIDFTPSLAETEAVKAKLRVQLYGQINDELKHLNDAEPGRSFRVGTVSFDMAETAPRPHPLPMVRMGVASPAMAQFQPPTDDNNVAVQAKITMTADVALEAVPPKQP
jgi:uncharacterized protein YggE